MNTYGYPMVVDWGENILKKEDQTPLSDLFCLLLSLLGTSFEFTNILEHSQHPTIDVSIQDFLFIQNSFAMTMVVVVEKKV